MILKKLKIFLDFLFQSESAKLLVIEGEAGCGKTSSVLSYLKDNNIQFVYVNGYTTPYKLFLLVKQNPNKVFVIDDVEDLLKNKTTRSLLKAMTDPMHSEVRYMSSAVGEEETVYFFGKVIIILNSISAKLLGNGDVKAILDRGIHVIVEMTPEEKFEIVKKILGKKIDTTKQKILYKLLQLKNLSVRKAIQIAEMLNKSKSLKEFLMCVRNLCGMNDVDVAILIVSLSNISVKKQEEIVCKQFGISRATFYYRKKKLLGR